MERTEAIFRWVFGLAPDRGYELHFDTVPDIGMPAADLAYRKSREKRSLEGIYELSIQIRTVAEFHQFLFTQHNAYSAAGSVKEREPAPEELQRVY